MGEGDKPGESLKSLTYFVADPLVRWAIIDTKTGRPYIQVVWTEKQARRELTDLLRPFSKDNPWRQRLQVGEWTRPFKDRSHSY